MRISHFLLLLSFALLLTVDSIAQPEFHRSNEIPVLLGENEMEQAWSGGINSSQWSTIDLDVDGHEDLFIFDRSSKQIHTYLKDPVDGSYHLSFEYVAQFPPIRDWVLLRDFNCDGRKDIFTSIPGGITVYENTTTNGILSFELRQQLLKTLYDFGTDPYYSSIYVSTVDIPSIDDFDGDGDLDIHTFTLSGTTIEYHKNFAMEMGDCDSLAFELENRCYGMLAEDAVSPVVYIGQDYIDGEFCTYNVVDPDEVADDSRTGGVHSGSSLCSFDYDGNGQRDLLIGDITGRNLTLALIEDRGPLVDSTFALDFPFPSADIPMDLHVFNNGYFEDVDNDGVRDLITTPSSGTESEDRESCYFYKNLGEDDNMDLELQTTSFIQGDMIDIGTIAIPRILDYNQDGLPDLVLSNRGKYQDGGLYEEKVWLFENVGSATYPIFRLESENFQELNDLGIGDHLATAFGDLDNDGDQDMVIGDGTGHVLFFENIAAPGMPVDFDLNYTFLESNGNTVDLGANLVPQLFDLDDDGLLDLLIGERNGNLNYLRNEGTAASYDFVLVEDSIGDINTDVDGNLIGYCTPWFFRTQGGEIQAIIGGESGRLYYLTDIDPDPSATWPIEDNAAFGVYNGIYSCPVMADLDADNNLDIINGGYSGGLGLYMGGALPSGIDDIAATGSQLTVFPNPAEGQVTLSLSKGLLQGDLTVSDLTGRILIVMNNVKGSTIDLDVSSLSKGVYHVSVRNGPSVSVVQFIKQ